MIKNGYFFTLEINSAVITTTEVEIWYLRLFDVLKNFPFTTSETIRDYYLHTWYIRVASRVDLGS